MKHSSSRRGNRSVLLVRFLALSLGRAVAGVGSPVAQAQTTYTFKTTSDIWNNWANGTSSSDGAVVPNATGIIVGNSSSQPRPATVTTTLDISATVGQIQALHSSSRHWIIDDAGNAVMQTLNNTGAGALTLTKRTSTTRTPTLSGTNSNSGATTGSTGALVFASEAAKSSSSTITAAGAKVGLGVSEGGVTDYSESDLSTLFSTGRLGGATGINLNATSNVAVDTAAGNFTQTSALTAARSLTKLSANTMVPGVANTYTDGTILKAGNFRLDVSKALNTTHGTLVLVNTQALGTASIITQSGSGNNGTLRFATDGGNIVYQPGPGTGSSVSINLRGSRVSLERGREHRRCGGRGSFDADRAQRGCGWGCGVKEVNGGRVRRGGSVAGRAVCSLKPGLSLRDSSQSVGAS